MGSASVFVFCTPDELGDWIRSLCEKKDLGSISFCDSSDEGSVVTEAGQFALHPDTYRVFLYPLDEAPPETLHLGDVKSRDWGWVDVRPGRLGVEGEAEYLLLSEVHGEDFDYEPVHPAKFVRWLKRESHGVITAGVVGRNVDTGGESSYRDIGFTDAALKLNQAGVHWKQFADGRVVFEPIPPSATNG